LYLLFVVHIFAEKILALILSFCNRYFENIAKFKATQHFLTSLYWASYFLYMCLEEEKKTIVMQTIRIPVKY